MEKYRWSVLALTFLSYTMYHATRKPPSIVKSVLNPDSTQRELGRDGWEPFSGPDGNSLLGSIDVSFLRHIHRNVLFRPHWRFDGFEEIFNHWDGWVWTVRLHVWYGIFLRHSLNVLFCFRANYTGVSINRMAVGCVCGWELVWEEQKRFNYGRMERAHISGEYSRLADCGEMFERLELGDVAIIPGVLMR